MINLSSLNGLGEAHRASGEPTLAIPEHSAALTLACQAENPYEQARAHEGMARAQLDLCRSERAREHAERALEIFTALRTPEADRLRALSATLGGAGGFWPA